MGAQCGGGTATDAEVFEVAEAGFSIPVRTVKKMGWLPDLPDFRDRQLNLPGHKKSNLPATVDLRKADSTFAIFDQGHLGSCTANAIAAAVHFDLVKLQMQAFTPSRLFIYYNERAMMGTTDKDSGAQIRDGIKSVHKLGVCSEETWKYDVDKFTIRPPSEAYVEALKTKAKEYAQVPQTLEDLKGILNEGFPFVFGFIVFDSFMTKEVATTGIMPMPQMYQKVLGGHAVMCCGYDDAKKCFLIRNSWGESWGDKGHFWMPFDYMTNMFLVRDIWVVKVMEGEALPTTRAAEF